MPPERTLVLVPDLRTPRLHADNAAERGIASRLAEAEGLARAISLDIVDSRVVRIQQVRPSTYIGAGKVDEIARQVGEQQIGLAIVDCALSPVQQRNLEKAWNCKILDRTGLILEIFGARARTAEGRLQVELARLSYQKGRLVRQWTHLERQRGGLGKTGGPGETQIEADRRLIQERIEKLRRDLDKVRRTRSLHRSRRQKAPVSVVVLVGYTNAGKSTLFNRVTGAKVFAHDLLFATLDPTLRKVALPSGLDIVLSDTVGFVSELPTNLVAAFRATLEEVVEADLILHVRDIADTDSAAQASDVYDVLAQIGIGEQGRERVLEVWNKIDLLADRDLEALRGTRIEGSLAPVPVSAITGEGISDLLAAIDTRLANGGTTFDIALAPPELGHLPEIYRLGRVLERRDLDDGGVWLRVKPQPHSAERLRRLANGAVAPLRRAAQA